MSIGKLVLNAYSLLEESEKTWSKHITFSFATFLIISLFWLSDSCAIYRLFAVFISCLVLADTVALLSA
jgi:hypothetical protein